MIVLEFAKQFESIKNSAIETLNSIFPLNGKSHTLKTNKVWADDKLDYTDFESQKKAKMNDRTWGVPVYADLSLVENATGKVLDREPRIKLFTLPKYTPRASFIVKGNEYQFKNQLRLRPGVYTTRTQTDEISSMINMARGGRGRSVHVGLTPSTGIFKLEISAGESKLYPLLKTLGVSDKDMREAWGDEIYQANSSVTPESIKKEVGKIAKSLGLGSSESLETMKDSINEYLKETELDKEITKITLGKEFDKVSGPQLLETSKKVLRVYRGDDQPDDKNSLMFKAINSAEDFISERLAKSKKDILFKMKRNLDNKNKIGDLISLKNFNDIIEKEFMTGHAAVTDQTNPIGMVGEASHVSITGEGGISNMQMLTDEMRSLHPSHFGFIDPVHTPEGEHIGTSLRLAMGANKDGKTLKANVYNVKTGRNESVDPIKMNGLVVGLPDQFTYEDGKIKWISSKVKAMHKGHIVDAPTSEVTHVVLKTNSMFSSTANLIPFLQNDHGTRAMMASKQIEQALPLKHREEPLVKPIMYEQRSMYDILGKGFSSSSPVDGTVHKIDNNKIVIKDPKGKLLKVNLYHQFPLNMKTSLDSTPVVKKGDKVAKGQLIADTNFTKNGVLAQGINLRTALLPYKGLNFEDGVVITESAAKKLTSEHTYNFEVEIGKNTTLNAGKFQRLYPAVFKTELINKMDEDGVIKKGSKVSYKDPLVLVLKKDVEDEEDAILGRLRKSFVIPLKNRSVEWDREITGIVTDVIKTPRMVKIYVKTEEPAIQGDKITGRHGNKGIITKVIPDSEAPHNKQGEPVEVIFNPHGIVSRMNLGQVYEGVVSKVAKEIGRPISTANFQPNSDSLQKVKDLVKKYKISETEELFDPETGKSLGQIFVGNPYTLKLYKQSMTNFSARSRDKYDITTMAPQRGGETGGKGLDLLTFYSMLAHGSLENLRESATYKAEKNDEFWAAFQNNSTLPPPKTTFAYNKFIEMLKASGVNVEKSGSTLSLVPLTDQDVLKMSSGALVHPMKRFKSGKSIVEERGGMFDPVLTGGKKGNRWSHIKLTEPIPSPMFEDAIKKLLNMPEGKYNKILYGELKVNDKGEIDEKGKYVGGEAFKKMLQKIDVNKDLIRLQEEAKTAKKTKLNIINNQLRYLKALKQTEMTPEQAYIINYVPVIPPVFRPVITSPDSHDLKTSPINDLYMAVGLNNKSLEEVNKWSTKVHGFEAPAAEKGEARKSVYNAVKSLFGLMEPKAAGIGVHDKNIKGFLEEIAGDQPKKGYFQRKLLKRKQDVVGRGTIIPDPALHIDEAGIPEKMAWKIFNEFVIKEFLSNGYSIEDAHKHVVEQTPTAKAFLELVMNKQPVLLNRAPSLHKFSIMAFKPKLTSGTAVKIPPLVVKGFNADFDGDEQIAIVIAFLNDYGISLVDSQHGVDFLKERKIMSARFKVKVPTLNENGEMFVFNLQDFPHVELIASKDGEKGKIDFFHALPGTKVIAMDEKNGKLVWADVAGWSKHYKREIEIVTMESGNQIISDDDPRAVYGIKSGELDYTRTTPRDAAEKHMFVPRSIRTECLSEKDGDEKDFELGYLFGAYSGNGWKDNVGRVFLCNSDENCGKKFQYILRKYFKADGRDCKQERLTGEHNSYGPAIKWSILSREAAECLDTAIGRGAREKHLPPNFITASYSYRQGLLAGIMDNDGSISVSHGKTKPQLMASYTSSSIRMIQEIQLLSSSIGIKSTIIPTKTPTGEPFWNLTLSSVDIKKWNGFGMVHKDKLTKLNSCDVDAKSTSVAKTDIIPISQQLAESITWQLGAKRSAPLDQKAFYTVFAKAKTCGYVSRITANKIFTYIPEHVCRELPDFDKWWKIVLNTDVTWDKVVGFQKTGIKEDGYDLTVPGYETFMSVGGVILSNTMTVHVPITPKAVKEAQNMYPSKNLFNPGSGALMIRPEEAAALGIYKLSQTAQGRDVLNKVVRKNIPRHPPITNVMDKKEASLFFENAAKNYPQVYDRLVDGLKEVGDIHAYRSGFSIKLSDLDSVSKERNVILDDAQKRADKILKSNLSQHEKVKQAESIYTQADDKIANILKKQMDKTHNNFYEMIKAGAKGKFSQIKQMLATPTLVKDYKDELILTPIKKSLSEGLSVADFWNNQQGNRTGMIDKGLQVEKPGDFNKVMMATTVSTIIGGKDCKTKEGLIRDITDQDNNGRYLAKSVMVSGKQLASSGDLLDSGMISKLKKARVKTVEVRSPMKCKLLKGVCSKCYGLNPEGNQYQNGDNIGAIAGQAMSEPLTQMVLRSFHTGAVLGTAPVGYDKISTLLNMPKKVPAKATLAEQDGKITKIENAPAGGQNVFVNDKPHYVERGRILQVKKGQEVKRGDQLSDGIIKSQELLQLKGMDAVQNYLVDELNKSYKEQGVKINKRNFETVVRAGTDAAIITNAGGHPSFVQGDIVPYSTINYFNQKGRFKKVPLQTAIGHKLYESVPGYRAGTEVDGPMVTKLKQMKISEVAVELEPIKYNTTLVGMTNMPYTKRDWMGQMGYRYLKDAIQKGVSERWQSDVSDPFSPIPGFAHGALFGTNPQVEI